MGMIRSEAEAKNEILNYRAGEATGTVRILSTPPLLSTMGSTL
jgi:hypothetical protein